MQTTVSTVRAWWRGAALLVALVLLELALIHEAGPVGAQVRVLVQLGEPWGDPVAGVLAVLAVVAELLAGYLVVVLALRLAIWLPGASGRLAVRGTRLVTPPVLRRVLDGLLGGVLLAQVTLAPVAARAEPGSSVAEHPAVAAASALAGGSAASSRGRQPSQSGGFPSGSTVPPPTWVPLPTWLGGSQAPGVDGTAASTAGPAPGAGEPAPPATGGAGPEASTPSGSAPVGGSAIEPGVGAGGSRRYVVRPGDTLWDVAAAHLPPGDRAPARVDRYWRQIHAANRAVLGDDPDLIHPGARLAVQPFQPARTGGG